MNYVQPDRLNEICFSSRGVRQTDTAHLMDIFYLKVILEQQTLTHARMHADISFLQTAVEDVSAR